MAIRVRGSISTGSNSTNVSPFTVFLLGEKAAALSALERASREHAVELIQLENYPPFRTLASEPRYQELMGRASPDS
jgi:hypothetical protein